MNGTCIVFCRSFSFHIRPDSLYIVAYILYRWFWQWLIISWNKSVHRILDAKLKIMQTLLNNGCLLLLCDVWFQCWFELRTQLPHLLPTVVKPSHNDHWWICISLQQNYCESCRTSNCRTKSVTKFEIAPQWLFHCRFQDRYSQRDYLMQSTV